MGKYETTITNDFQDYISLCLCNIFLRLLSLEVDDVLCRSVLMETPERLFFISLTLFSDSLTNSYSKITNKYQLK